MAATHSSQNEACGPLAFRWNNTDVPEEYRSPLKADETFLLFPGSVNVDLFTIEHVETAWCEQVVLPEVWPDVCQDLEENL